MEGHLILCGLGHVGFRVFELLHRAGERVVVVALAPKPERRAALEAVGAVLIEGDARDERMLLRAGLRSARAVLALTDDDLANLSVALDARRLAPAVRVVVRMFDVDLGRHVGGTLSIDRVFSTSAIAAPVFASSALGHDALALLADRQLAVWEADVGAAGVELIRDGDRALVLQPLAVAPPLAVSVRLSGAPRPLVRVAGALAAVVAVSALLLQPLLGLDPIDALYLTVTTITTVGYGDFNFSQASAAAKLFGCLLMLAGAALMAMLFSAMTELVLTEKLTGLLRTLPLPTSGHTLVVGAGHIGARVVERLTAAGAVAVLIEGERTGSFSADLHRTTPRVAGDPRSDETLERAQVRGATALLALCEDDVENLGVALAARRINPALRASVRVFDVELGRKLQDRLGLDRVLSVSALAAPYFAGAVYEPELEVAVVWRDRLVLVLRDPGAAEASRVALPGGGAVAVRVVHLAPAPGDAADE